MQKRSVASVILLSLVTFGIYTLVWFVKTKDEMVEKGADIPTALWIFVPFGGLYWLWKWAGGVQLVTRGKLTQGAAFCLNFFLGLVGAAIVQDAFNGVVDEAAPVELPIARIARIV